jgi:salicylate hydroxylase
MRASFPDPEPRLAKLLSIVTQCSKWGLFTRPLTQNWGRARIQLIGDAAHAMLPNAGQGACQAFEDAYILARWLEACRDPLEAFANFRRIRIPRVHGVQRLSISNARFKHMRDRAAQKVGASGKAASTAAPTGSGDTIPLANGTKALFPTAYAAGFIARQRPIRARGVIVDVRCWHKQACERRDPMSAYEDKADVAQHHQFVAMTRFVMYCSEFTAR